MLRLFVLSILCSLGVEVSHAQQEIIVSQEDSPLEITRYRSWFVQDANFGEIRHDLELRNKTDAFVTAYSVTTVSFNVFNELIDVSAAAGVGNYGPETPLRA